MMEDEEESAVGLSEWWALPEPIFFRILSLLTPREILNVSSVCKRWHEIAYDDYLWKKKFLQDFKLQETIGLKPGADSWRAEYERLTLNVPMVQTELLEAHSNQVLHVSFSHNGEMFATCSKDCNVIIWNSAYPCTEKYSQNMKQFSWKYTQYSQFNQSDTLLLVSGVHFGTPQSTSGEIAVFTLEKGSNLRCRVVNRPYDIFGTWFSDQYLISGDLHWIAHLVSTSVLWLNKANQEIASEHIPIMNQLYKFYNKNASSIRVLMIAKCPWLEDIPDPLEGDSSETTPPALDASSPTSSAGNPISHSSLKTVYRQDSFDREFLFDNPPMISSNGDDGFLVRLGNSTIRYVDEFHKNYEENSCSGGEDSSVGEPTVDEEDELDNSVPRYLIFATGSKTYTPHQIGIKRIRNVNFPKKMDPGLSLRERIAARKREREEQNSQPRVEPDWWNYEAVADRFDKIDKVIDLHAHIIGMALSPDHRYLYVNTRAWPKNYVISNPLEPPPIAQQIDIHVIDLKTLKLVGNMLCNHKAYTANIDCLFIFLDVCDNYVSSGSEDMHAYLWDRYYGMCLAKYKHNDVVNSVAFNPKDNEMLVTAGDDHKIKVWRSKYRSKQLGVAGAPVAKSS